MRQAISHPSSIVAFRRILASFLLLASVALPLQVWATVDTDNDGLYDTDEAQYGTSPSNADTDNDGIVDGWEVLLGDNPLLARYALIGSTVPRGMSFGPSCMGGGVTGEFVLTDDNGQKTWKIGSSTAHIGGAFTLPGQVTLASSASTYDEVDFTCTNDSTSLTCQRGSTAYRKDLTSLSGCRNTNRTVIGTGITPSPWTLPVNNPRFIAMGRDLVCSLNKDFTVQCFDVSNWGGSASVSYPGKVLFFDADKDGVQNSDDLDDDNDGTPDVSDTEPFNPFVGGATNDNDNDGVPNNVDNCRLHSNADQADDDQDGIGNPCDSDGPGKLDFAFNPGTGANSNVVAMVQQADGKVLIGGNFTSYNGVAINRIARLNSDGSLDTGFNPGTGVNNYVVAMVQQADGKVLIGGDFTSYNGLAINRIARLNSDGSLDTGFNPGTGVNSYVQAMVQQADGKVLIGGGFTSYNGVAMNSIARLNSDGSLDAGFNPGADSTVRSVALQTDGKVLIGGFFKKINGVSRNYIARLNGDGSLDAGFHPDIGGIDSITDPPYVRAAALQADGKVLIGGHFTKVNGVSRNHIARLNSDGSLDAGFNPGAGAGSRVESVALQTDGKVLIGGSFTTYNLTTRKFLARIHTGDADADGVEDGSDKFPLDSAEWLDTDNDGIGNNADYDDDNDGIPDYIDADPLNAAINTEKSLPVNGDYKGSAIRELQTVQ